MRRMMPWLTALLVLLAMATVGWLRKPAMVGERPQAQPAAVVAGTPARATLRAPTAAEVETLRQALLPGLRSSEREVARVRLEALQPDDPFVSKVGGAPYLPRGEALPQTPAGVPMVLLAQLNFAELPPMQGYPRDGIFQILISPADGDTYGVDVSVETLTVETLSTQRLFRARYWPAPLLTREALHQIAPPDTQGRTPHAPDKPRRMRFEAAREEITVNDAGFAVRFGIAPWDYIDAAAKRLEVDPLRLFEAVYNGGEGHKVGGYPFFTQADPRPLGSPLQLLLQLDSDNEMLWGDAGVGNVFISPQDLARADFSRVLYSWDNH